MRPESFKKILNHFHLKQEHSHTNANYAPRKEHCNYWLICCRKVIKHTETERNLVHKIFNNLQQIQVKGILNSFTSDRISMMSMRCSKICDLDFWALAISLIECRLLIMSLANESENINIPNANVKKDVNFRQAKETITNCMHMAKK